MLSAILKSNDITMVEGSVQTFEALCAHQDPANLAADVNHTRQYEEIVRLYAQFASKEVAPPSKVPISWPVAIRFRKAGLLAIKAAASSDSLVSETGRQLSMIIPAILYNVLSENGTYLRTLEEREKELEEQEKDQAFRRRQSVSTVRTAGTEGDPVAASGTTEDADKLAEEEVGIVALQAFRNIFVGVNRGQLRLATSAVLTFISCNVKIDRHLSTEKGQPSHDNSWPTTILAMICGWAPVQDRYAILVGATETLTLSPIVESELEGQLVLATSINFLLSSAINFIGLSVMDLLIGLISHTLLLLQLAGPDTTVMPQQPQTSPIMSEKEFKDPKSSGSLAGGIVVELVKNPSQLRVQLLATLQKCMASLATHVYYTDQISDMVSAILKRLKPRSPGAPDIAAAIDDPTGALDAVASSASLQEKSHVNKFFSFETARLTALGAVKDILLVANARRPDGSVPSDSRSAVGVRVWEGTQWLLRDPSGQVRKAYTDALVTWLNLEMKKSDLRVIDDGWKKDKENLARRAVSNASKPERSSKRNKNTFLALLNLAIYENAHQYVDSEPDLLLLHLLLTTLVNKLGVNSVRSSLPMILRLQEDIQTFENPSSKIRIGSLVHGYLWAVSMALDFETSAVGRTLHAEISRRNDKGLWLSSIRVPPLPLDRIQVPSSHTGPAGVSKEVVQTEALKPFDNREMLVEKIAASYSYTLVSPPSSPPGSPGRSKTFPILAQPGPEPTPQLSSKVKDEMLTEWSKEQCIASNTKDNGSTASVTGSRTVASVNQKNNYLGITIPNGNLDSVNSSPLPTPRRAHSRPPSAAYGLMGRIHSPHRNRSPSGTQGSSSSLHSAVKVEDLKRVLSGSAPRTSYSTARPASHRHPNDRETHSSSSDSMVSADLSLSDSSFVTPDQSPADRAPSTASPELTTTSPRATSPRTVTSYAVTNAARERETALLSDVPPVPPIPASLRENSVSPTPTPSRPKTAPSNNASPVPGSASANGGLGVRKSRSMKRGNVAASSKGPGSDRSASGSRGRVNSGAGSGRISSRGQKKPDFSNFLEGIESDGSGGEGDDVRGVMGGGIKPPY